VRAGLGDPVQWVVAKGSLLADARALTAPSRPFAILGRLRQTEGRMVLERAVGSKE